MDDEVRALTVKCAEALGMENPYHPGDTDMGSIQRWNDFNPAENDDQAFELLCWLKSRGVVVMTESTFRFNLFEPGWPIVDQECKTDAELRLAIMRATVKVHEGSKP